MAHVNGSGLKPAPSKAIFGREGVTALTEIPLREIVTVPILSIRPGESPRLNGEDESHIMRLAETEATLPPILIERSSMRVIDGMHRFRAASLRGQETIEAEFFNGSANDAFLRAVEENVTHGLPLSHADRRAAAARIMTSHPHMSDRAIAESAGLAARTVAGIRRGSAGLAPELSARVGKDGRVRPLSCEEGRRRAAELLAENPQTSLREVARGAGVSPATASDVRKRLERGADPAPAKQRARGGDGNPTGPRQPARPRARPGVKLVAPPPAFVLEKLLRDPALRHNEQGRRLLRWLQHNAITAQECSGLIAAVPPHCVALVAQLAHQYSEMWLNFAGKLDERARVADSSAATSVLCMTSRIS